MGSAMQAGANGSAPPGVCRPAIVLVTELGPGSFIVQGYPTGPSTFVRATDGTVLRAALDAAFSEAGTEIDVPPRVRPRIWHR